MSPIAQPSARIAQHTLLISDPALSLAFYQDCLGMALIAEHQRPCGAGTERHLLLGFREPGGQGHSETKIQSTCGAILELIHRPDWSAAQSPDPADRDGYWKIGITIADVDLARRNLIDAGIQVSDATQFLDVGYLCHLRDPDGYSIELLQHDFAANHEPSTPDVKFKLGSPPILAHITLRIIDPDKSLQFYQDGLGLRLLSRQIIEAHQFTLYFLAWTNDRPPYDDIDEVKNREWLWRRPYTVLELQHVWHADSGRRGYRVGSETGFERITFATNNVDGVLSSLGNEVLTVRAPGSIGLLERTKITDVLDPDGYTVRFVETA